jgi:hypothetical protein
MPTTVVLEAIYTTYKFSSVKCRSWNVEQAYIDAEAGRYGKTAGQENRTNEE